MCVFMWLYVYGLVCTLQLGRKVIEGELGLSKKLNQIWLSGNIVIYFDRTKYKQRNFSNLLHKGQIIPFLKVNSISFLWS